MRPQLHAGLGLVAAVVAVVAVSGCGPEVRQTGPSARSGGDAVAASAPAPATSVWTEAFEKEQLETRRLEKIWDVYLGEKILDMWQREDSLYVFTNLNRLYSVGLSDGLVRWQYQGLEHGISYPPGTYAYGDDGFEHADELYLVSHDVLHVLDRQHGYLLWKLRLPFAASSPPTGSNSHVYIGSWDNRVYAISKDGYVDWCYRTGDSVTAAPEPTERSVEAVFVASEDGVVYAMNPVHEERKWYFPTRGALVSSPLFFRNHVYIASRDMTFYCLRSADGGLEWKVPTGAVLSKQAIAFTRDLAYVSADNGSLLAVNLQPDVKGTYIRWHREGCEGPIAHGRGDVYVLEQHGGIVALNEKTGETRWERALEVHADYYTVNGYSAKSRRKRERNLSTIMAFGYEAGWIHAIKEKGEY